MKSARSKFLFLSFFLAGLLVASQAFSAEDTSSKADFNDVKTRLTALEQGQKEILAKEDEILKQLDVLKIWVHRK